MKTGKRRRAACVHPAAPTTTAPARHPLTFSSATSNASKPMRLAPLGLTAVKIRSASVQRVGRWTRFYGEVGAGGPKCSGKAAALSKPCTAAFSTGAVPACGGEALAVQRCVAHHPVQGLGGG